jgi:16S rRNA (cytosine967-C5)-methyltransferase
VLAACVDRPLRKVEAKVLDACASGTHQLLSDAGARHAAISTTVDLVRSGSARAGRVRNAVLRRVAEHDLAGGSPGGTRPGHRPDRVRVVAHSHPRWVVEELARRGEDELDALLAADNEAPA